MTRNRVSLSGVLLALALTACGHPSDVAPDRYDSGIRGRAMVDGGCPVIRQDRPCPDKPIPTEIVATPVGSDKPAATGTSDQDGYFELALAPGDYVISGAPAEGATFPFAKPVGVTVSGHAFTWVRVAFDSGIR